MSDLQDQEFTGRRNRRRRRLQERKVALSIASLFAIGLVVGLAVALYLSWLVFPTDTSASPADFRPDFKTDYIYMVSQGYAKDGDLTRAETRLALLEDPNLSETLRAQLEDYLRQGQPADAVRNLANLSVAMGVEGTSIGLFGPGETAVTATPTPTPTPTPQVTPTLLPLITPTPPPSPSPPPLAVTAAPTAEPIYRLLDQEEVCRPADQLPLIAVNVLDAFLDDLPGITVDVSWADGEDQFITGFKSGEAAGYGDFAMSPEVTYTVVLPDGSGPVSGLTTGPCSLSGSEDEGQTGWILTFQKLVASED